MWLGLSACGSMLLLSVTNHLTENVAPIPLLWVLPLALYLLTFALAFNRPSLYWRWLIVRLLAVAWERSVRALRSVVHRIGAGKRAGVLHRPVSVLLLLSRRTGQAPPGFAVSHLVSI